MVTGSYASSIHGMPRATRDIDIIVMPTRDQLARFIEQLPHSSYYSALEDAIEALRRRRQFNIIDLSTGWKVDFIIPPLTEFHVEGVQRPQGAGRDGRR